MAVVVNPDPGEEGGEELAFHSTGGRGEEGVGSGHEVEVAEHHLGVLLEGLGGGIEAGSDFVLLDLQVSEPEAEFICSECSVGSEVDETFLLHVELLQFLLQACALFGVPGEYVIECCLHFSLCLVDGFGGEAEAGELAGECAFEFCGGEIGQIAKAVLASPTEEVFVDLIRVVLGLGEDEAVFAPGIVAAAAVQHAAGEVIVDTVTLSPFHAGVDDLLHTVEERRSHERLVPTWVDVSLEGDHSEVVRVAEDETELAP
nr:hypothetical protein [Microbacterium sp. Leaf179]